jgi:DNA-binding SARP family transcriptional activator
MIEFRALGPLEVVNDGSPLALGGGKQRALLAMLLLHANEVVSSERLIDELWGEAPPATVSKSIHVYVSRLRKELGEERLVTRSPGYVLRVEPGEFDLQRFEGLLAEARDGDADAATTARTLREALALWRGAPLADLAYEPFAQPEIARLEELRWAALEARIDAELASGRHAELVGELQALVAEHPLREHLHGQLMLAFYRSGRQADALELYRRTRETLSEELGIEPGLELQELERRMLQHDPELERPRPALRPAEDGAPVPIARRPQVLVLAALALAAVAAAIAAIALTAGGSSGNSSSGELRSFVVKLENFLVQSKDGRRTVAAAVGGASRCTLSPSAAVTRLNQVQRNRQSLLQQFAALAVPNTEQALRASDLLQQSIRASFTADGHYSDWLAGRKRCGPPGKSPELAAAHAADAQASRTKRMFVAAFNPLARRFARRTWAADEF